MTEQSVTETVRSFAGFAGRNLLVEGSTVGTGYPSGRAIVCGRPYSVDGKPVEIDPDGDIKQIERDLLRLDGKFSLVAQGQKRWVLATDLLGTGGAFLAQTRRGILVASSLGGAAALADHNDYDLRGVVTALLGSVSLNRVTPFAGVRRLQAAEYALIDLRSTKDTQIRAYAEPADVLLPHGDRPGSIHELRELIQSAVAREKPDERTGLLLTGGKDSQAIGHAIDGSLRTKVTAFTYGGWRSTDRRGARLAAQRIGVKHERVGPLALRLSDHSEVIVRVGGGQSGLQVSQHLAGVKSVGRRVDKALTGFLGGILTGAKFVSSRDREREILQSRHMPWLKDAGVDLTAEFPNEVEQMRSDLLARWSHYTDLPPGRAAMLVELTHRQASYISGTFDLMNQYVDIATPFFHRSTIRYLLTRRSQDLIGQRLYSEMLRGNSLSTLKQRATAIDVMASWVNRRTGDRYGTVNWHRVMQRERRWLQNSLAHHANHDRIAQLGLRSLSTDARLPLALFALPLVETRHRITHDASKRSP